MNVRKDIYNVHSHLVVRGSHKVPAGAVLLVAPVDAVRAQVADLGPRDALVHLLAAEVARAAVRLECEDDEIEWSSTGIV